MEQSILETNRLIIRPFIDDDLAVIHRILDQAFGDGDKAHDPAALLERRSWLAWSTLSQEWLPRMHQPPYGDRAITLKPGGEVIGAVGFVPLLDAYEQIPELRLSEVFGNYNTPEVGLFWAIDVLHQGQGYATEAARVMVEHAFRELRLKRILATTEYENIASQGVMRKLGMQLTRNPLPEPHWLQVVGVLYHPEQGRGPIRPA